MPAQIHVTKLQAKEIADLDEDVIICEPPGGVTVLDVWVLDEASIEINSTHHRSVILDVDGNVLGDQEDVPD